MMREPEIIKLTKGSFKNSTSGRFSEASKLEGQLHLGRVRRGATVRVTMKDKAFDEMIACKDAKMLTNGYELSTVTHSP